MTKVIFLTRRLICHICIHFSRRHWIRNLFPFGGFIQYCSFFCSVFLNRLLTDVTYVCMDESAVSSDPVTAFLLDEVVVKDWCKRTFQSILEELQKICILIYEHLGWFLS